MDIGSPYHLRSLGVAPSDSGLRFDTVEVRSSSLLVPTIFSITYGKVAVQLRAYYCTVSEMGCFRNV